MFKKHIINLKKKLNFLIFSSLSLRGYVACLRLFVQVSTYRCFSWLDFLCLSLLPIQECIDTFSFCFTFTSLSAFQMYSGLFVRILFLKLIFNFGNGNLIYDVHALPSFSSAIWRGLYTFFSLSYFAIIFSRFFFVKS